MSLENKKLILTAKTSAKDLLPGEISLFPTETVSSVSFSQEELLRLSPLYSRLYADLIEKLGPGLSRWFQVPEEASRIFAREAVVPLTHFFLDRFLRLERLVHTVPKENLAIATIPFEIIPTRIEEFEQMVCSSLPFNQALLGRLARILDLEEGPPLVFPSDPLREAKKNSSNHNYSQPLFLKFRRKFHLALVRLLSQLGLFHEGKIPVLTLGYATFALQARGFYGPSGFVGVSRRLSFPSIPGNPAWRRETLQPLLMEAAPFVDHFLRDAGVNDPERRHRAADGLRDFLSEFYPSDLLEGIPTHLPAAAAVLKKYPGKAILCADAGNIESTFFFAAARLLGMQIIGCQPGGHEGYENDYVQSGEAEYHYFDKFITWGWNRYPSCKAFDKVLFLSLPSPWLDYRRRLWAPLLANNHSPKDGRKYDFLLMPNKIYPFPPSPSGANVSRIDHIQAFAATLKEFVSKAAQQGLSVLHKPCNEPTKYLLAKTLRELEDLGGKNYACYPLCDKGLTPELIKQCRLVVWDQPGTGFLECLTSRIPTMILWPRLYNQEAPWCRDIFAELENVGVVHRTTDSLLKEYGRFLPSPSRWMNNPDRLDVVNRFCRLYAWTDSNWPSDWHRFVKSLADR